jgi:hypothetical protein
MGEPSLFGSTIGCRLGKAVSLGCVSIKNGLYHRGGCRNGIDMSDHRWYRRFSSHCFARHISPSLSFIGGYQTQRLRSPLVGVDLQMPTVACPCFFAQDRMGPTKMIVLSIQKDYTVGGVPHSRCRVRLHVKSKSFCLYEALSRMRTNPTRL